MTNDLGDQLGRIRDYAGEKAAGASEQIREASARARETATVALEASREKAGEIAGELKERGGKFIEENPLAVVAGGLALGALIGVLLPKRKRKAPAPSRLAAGLAAAKGAGTAASEGIAKAAHRIRERIEDIDTGAAREKLGDMADSKAIKQRIGDLVERAGEAVSSASKSAAESLRRKP